MTVNILHGDCRTVLASLPAASVHCVVTSPPYYGLRSYLPAGHPDKHLEIGLEGTPDEFVERLVGVFREIRRVLRDDGIAWVNMGDSFNSMGGGYSDTGSRGASATISSKTQAAVLKGRNRGGHVGLKVKDLIGIPWALAFALRAGFSTCTGCGEERRSDLWPLHHGRQVCIDCLLAGRTEARVRQTEKGWYLRRDVVWSKSNPMPESVQDRPATSHEYVFPLTKKQKYFYDGEAIREKMAAASVARLSQDVENQAGSTRANGGAKTNGPMKAVAKGNAKTFRGGGAYTRDQAFENSVLVDRASHGNAPNETGDRNSRSVWTIATQGYAGAHFATMPAALAERCIKAGSSQGGCCAACGAPFDRIVEKGEADIEHQRACGGDAAGEYHGASTKGHAAAGVQDASAVKARILAGMAVRKTTGWAPTCACPPAPPVPCVVLDPFGGSGTTGLVGDRLGRNCILIDLNADYLPMAAKRITADAGLFADLGEAA